MRHDAGQQPVVVAAVPDLVLAARRRGALLVQPQRVQLGEAAVGDVEHEALLGLGIGGVGRLLFGLLGLGGERKTICDLNIFSDKNRDKSRVVFL